MTESHKGFTEISFAPNPDQETKIRWLLNGILGDVPLRVIGKAIDVSGTSVERYKKGTRVPTGIVLERLLQGVGWAENKIEEEKIHELAGEAAVRARKQIQADLLDFFQSIGPQVKHIRNWSNIVKKITDDHKQRITEQYAREILKRIDCEERETEIFNMVKLAVDQIAVVLFDSFAMELTNISSLRHDDLSQRRSEEILDESAKAYREVAKYYAATWVDDHLSKVRGQNQDE
jgi:hypothetical protein